MASKLKVDEITTVGETGNIVIPGNVGIDGSQGTGCWKCYNERRRKSSFSNNKNQLSLF